MDPIYRIIDVDDWHAWTIGQVCRTEDGSLVARFTSGLTSAGGVPMKKSVAADSPGELVVLIRQSHPYALLCGIQ